MWVRQTDVTETGRICTHCKVFQEWKYFSKSRSGINWHSSACTICLRDIARLKKDKEREEKGLPPIIRLRIDLEWRECSDCLKYYTWDNFISGDKWVKKRPSVCNLCRPDHTKRWIDKKRKANKEKKERREDLFPKKKSTKEYWEDESVVKEKYIVKLAKNTGSEYLY